MSPAEWLVAVCLEPPRWTDTSPAPIVPMSTAVWSHERNVRSLAKNDHGDGAGRGLATPPPRVKTCRPVAKKCERSARRFVVVEFGGARVGDTRGGVAHQVQHITVLLAVVVDEEISVREARATSEAGSETAATCLARHHPSRRKGICLQFAPMTNRWKVLLHVTTGDPNLQRFANRELKFQDAARVRQYIL